jgi:putative transposase
MPWKETSLMEQRTEFALRALREEKPFRHLCAEYNIAPKTGYEWVRRFRKSGEMGMHDLSRRPLSSPKALDEDVACKLIRFKLAQPHWGPKKILSMYMDACPALPAPSISSVKRILGKVGLVEKRKRTRRAEDCGRISNRLVATAPNDLWSVDFKGWWYSTRKEKVVPLTVCDAFSRYVLMVHVVPDASTETVRRCFERLFLQHGMPKVIRSDNGAPFACTRAPLGLSRLSAWFVALGINLDRIEPGHPEQNGSHERMHRNIAMEVQGRIDGDLRAQQAALDIWHHDYNHLRPHEALAMQRPADLYRPSELRFDPELARVEYPQDYLRRKVSPRGVIHFENRLLQITAALAGWDVGLQMLSPDLFNVWFGSLRLGRLNLKLQKFAATGVEN